MRFKFEQLTTVWLHKWLSDYTTHGLAPREPTQRVTSLFAGLTTQVLPLDISALAGVTSAAISDFGSNTSGGDAIMSSTGNRTNEDLHDHLCRDRTFEMKIS